MCSPDYARDPFVVLDYLQSYTMNTCAYYFNKNSSDCISLTQALTTLTICFHKTETT